MHLEQLLSVRRRLFRASKKNDALESRVAVLKAEGSELRRTVEEGAAKQGEQTYSEPENGTAKQWAVPYTFGLCLGCALACPVFCSTRVGGGLQRR